MGRAEPAQGAEDYAKALDALIAAAKSAREELDSYAAFDDADEVPTLHTVEARLHDADRAWDALVTDLDRHG